MKATLTLFTMLLLVGNSWSQDKWSLQQCVEFAIDNSLSIESSELLVKDADLVSNAAWMERLPSINGNTSYNLSFGRRIDPSTNAFINQRFGNQTVGVSGGLMVFNNGRVNNNIKRSKLDSEAARLDLQQLQNDISLDVANTYLQILFARENASNASNRLALSQNQLDQIERLIKAGSRPRNASLELVAQVASAEQALIMARNDGALAMLNLKQLLQLEADQEFDIEIPELTLPNDYDIASLSSTEIYGIAVNNQPNVKAGEVRARGSEIGVELARSALYPSLSIGMSLGTNFSSVSARQGDPTGATLVSQPGVFVNGEPVMLEFLQPTFDINKVKYFDQLSENLGYGFGAQLQIPIFNQGQNRVSLQRAELDVRRTQVQNLNVKNQLRTTIESSVADVRAAKLNYDAALRTLEAARASYEDTQKRYDLGVANSFELTTTVNNRDQAEVDLLISKYDFIFKIKVLDFYQGKQITLD